MVKQIFDNTETADYVDFAIELIEKGYETEEILILAGLSYSGSKFDAFDMFSDCLASLSYEVPSNDELVIEYLQNLANDIILDIIPPQDGLHKLSGLRWQYSEFDIDSICDLSDIDILADAIIMLNNNDSDYNVSYRELRKDNVDDIIKDEVKLFLRSFSYKIPPEVLLTAYCNECGNRVTTTNVYKKQNFLDKLLGIPKQYIETVCSNCLSSHMDDRLPSGTQRSK